MLSSISTCLLLKIVFPSDKHSLMQWVTSPDAEVEVSSREEDFFSVVLWNHG